MVRLGRGPRLQLQLQEEAQARSIKSMEMGGPGWAVPAGELSQPPSRPPSFQEE